MSIHNGIINYEGGDALVKASSLFDPEPAGWGLRGDPYFWRYLKDRLAAADLPANPDQLEAFIRREHFRLSGKELTRKSIAVVGRFSHGGMTSGGISGEWWIQTGIPLLRARCSAAIEENSR